MKKVMISLSGTLFESLAASGKEGEGRYRGQAEGGKVREIQNEMGKGI